MIAFVIGLSIATTIFFITSAVVIIRRRQKANQNVGYIINEGGPPLSPPIHTSPVGLPQTHYGPPGMNITHYTLDGAPVTTQYPPSYQTNAYLPYPAQTSQLTVQMQAMPSQPPAYASMPPHGVNAAAAAVPQTDVTVLPGNAEKRPLEQLHTGAVESVSQI